MNLYNEPPLEGETDIALPPSLIKHLIVLIKLSWYFSKNRQSAKITRVFA